MYKVKTFTITGEFVNTFDDLEDALDWISVCVINKVRVEIRYEK
jgi:hypothetical protein